MGIENYRRRDEIEELDASAKRVNKVIADVRDNLELMHVAMNFGETEDVVEEWINATYDPLRELSRGDLAYAVVILVDNKARRKASEALDDLVDL